MLEDLQVLEALGDCICRNTTINGTGTNIGGIVGSGSASTSLVIDCIINGTTTGANNVGGVVGGGNSASTRFNAVINTQIISLGNTVGGVMRKQNSRRCLRLQFFTRLYYTRSF